ncbi:hypothetical protein J7E91_35490 [Streptomyces sp. ISL-99]|uniref:DUF6584 family protein n=1 Tax=Streptomyces sp. ISL-99 TaxID=2819193 RepID=UPI001BEABBEE|nr:DUF6584 family protein [Streptomyces sp. ISL-99]MBT2530507.1 hypothetical protein [Streptomyces sp. ISL-99]
MTLSETLDRVDADLAAGRVPLARQRLRGLVSSFPQDLLLRRRLGDIYRLYGEPVEVGRWMYLEADRDPAETAAFEERYAMPLRRMRALAWHAPESIAGTAFAAQQLEAVRKAGSAYLGRSVEWTAIPLDRDDEPEDERIPFTGRLVGVGVALGMVLMVLGFFAVWVFGFVTFVRWLWR